MADVKTINGYTVKDETARTAIENLNTVQLASSGGASGSIRFGVDSNGKYGYYEAGADTVTPFSEGGDFEETILWTNSSPTSSFGAQVITGLNNLSQYDYIGVYCRTSSSKDDETFELMPYDYFKNTQWVNSKLAFSVSYRGTDTLHTRAFTYVSDTSIHVSNNWYIAFNGTGDANNSVLIPVKIVGVKKGKQGLPDKYRLIKTGRTSTFSFNRDYDQLLIIAWGGGTTATSITVGGVQQEQLGLNSYYQTDCIVFNYKAGTSISIVTDPSGYKIWEIYKE